MTDEKPNYVNYECDNPAKNGSCYQKMSKGISRIFESSKKDFHDNLVGLAKEAKRIQELHKLSIRTQYGNEVGEK